MRKESISIGYQVEGDRLRAFFYSDLALYFYNQIKNDFSETVCCLANVELQIDSF